MQAVEIPDQAATLRSIFRWYSKTFHTPLPQVEEIPIEEVLLTYYESMYEDLNEEERAQEMKTLLKTPEDLQAERRRKDAERADAYDFMRFTAEEEKRKAEAEKRRLADLKPEEKRKFAKVPETALPKTPIKDLKETPPDIQMKFVNEDDFEAELEGFGSMVPAKKPQSSP